MALTVHMQAALKARLTGAGDLGTPTADINLDGQIVLASGTGANQADRIFADNRTLSASTTEDLDLAGVLTDPLGATLTLAKVKGIFIKAGAANPGDLTVGGDANAFAGIFGDASDTIKIPPGAILPLMWPGAGKTVTAGTGDILQFASAAGGPSTYDIVIVGTSA